MKVTLRNLVKRFGANVVLKAVSLEVLEHELFFLLGPSGCGKTTLLRVLAGFERVDEGEVWFGDRRIDGVPAHRRQAGMVFQNYALWPHLTVAENVGYGLDVRGVRGEERRRRIEEALEIVQMGGYAARSPNELSGGQQQRVALARALVVRPDVLLLDEPLSNLDARLRLEMRDEIRRIHEQTRLTTIYVTHDQKESLSMADRMAVMRDGVIEQLGTPREVYRAPANRFVAEFIGETNWLEGKVVGVKGAEYEVTTVAGVFSGGGVAGSRFEVGQSVWVGFRPEAVVLGGRKGESGVSEEHRRNVLRARVVQLTYLGEVEQYVLEAEAGNGLRLKATEQNPREVRQPGERVQVEVRSEDLFLLAHSLDSNPIEALSAVEKGGSIGIRRVRTSFPRSVD